MPRIIKKFTYDKGSSISEYLTFIILAIEYLVIDLVHNTVTGFMFQALSQHITR